MTNKRIVYLLIFILITCVVQVCCSAIRFAITDTTPLYWDYAYHMFLALEYYASLTRHNYLDIFAAFSRYPPFVVWGLALYILAFGYSKLTVMLYNLTALLVLLAGVFYFTKRKINTFAAVISTIFALGLLIHITQSYGIIRSLYDFMLDVPLVVSTFIAYSFLAYGIRKQSIRTATSLAIGVSFGIAILTKWTALSLLCLPLLWYCWTLFTRKQYRMIGVVLVGIVAGGGWWYTLHWRFLLTEWTAWYHRTDFYNSALDQYTTMVIRLIPLSLCWILPALPVLYTSVVSTKKYEWKTKAAGLLHSVLTWEIINVILSLLIYYLLPIHDFRFLYSTLFLFGMIIFWSIIDRATQSQRILVTIGVCLYTTLVIWYIQPNISHAVYAIDRLRQITQINSKTSLAIMYEDDTETFNAINVYLLNTENTLFHKDEYVQYMYLNNSSTNDFNSCNTNIAAHVLIIYTARPDMQDPQRHADFAHTCPPAFRNAYTQIATESVSDGTLRIFQKTSRP